MSALQCISVKKVLFWLRSVELHMVMVATTHNKPCNLCVYVHASENRKLMRLWETKKIKEIHLFVLEHSEGTIHSPIFIRSALKCSFWVRFFLGKLIPECFLEWLCIVISLCDNDLTMTARLTAAQPTCAFLSISLNAMADETQIWFASNQSKWQIHSMTSSTRHGYVTIYSEHQPIMILSQISFRSESKCHVWYTKHLMKCTLTNQIHIDHEYAWCEMPEMSPPPIPENLIQIYGQFTYFIAHKNHPCNQNLLCVRFFRHSSFFRHQLTVFERFYGIFIIVYVNWRCFQQTIDINYSFASCKSFRE